MGYNRCGLPKETDGLPGKRTGELACSLSADLYADGDTGVFPFAYAASRAAVHSGMAKAQSVIPLMIAVGIADGYKWKGALQQGYNRRQAGVGGSKAHRELFPICLVW